MLCHFLGNSLYLAGKIEIRAILRDSITSDRQGWAIFNVEILAGYSEGGLPLSTGSLDSVVQDVG